MLVVAPDADVWCVMALLVTPLQMAQAVHYRPSTISEAVVPLLWVLLWDAVIPASGLVIWCRCLGTRLLAYVFKSVQK